jgi:hypothetical protein
MKNSNIPTPYILINVDITLSSTQLKQKIIEEMSALGTTIQDLQKSECMLVITKKEKNIIKNICQIFFANKDDFTKIQLVTKNTLNRYDRLIEIKSLSGEPMNCENLITTFIKHLVKLAKKIKIIKKSENYFMNLESELNKELNIQQQLIKNKSTNSSVHLTEENSTILENINKEAANYYEIYKILSDENYDLGRTMKEFISNFKKENSDFDSNEAEEKAIQTLPNQIKVIIQTIDTCVNTFNNYFNYGKSNNETLLKVVRPAVVNFIFKKIYYILFSLYEKKYAVENTTYLDKKEKINKQLSISDIMSFLEIKDKFKCLEHYQPGSTNIPYKSTIDCINKIEFEQSPVEKLDTLINAGLELRNTILGSNAGKSELNSMDDELPIFIYLATQMNLKNSSAEFHFVEDYLKFCENEISESKVLTNLMSAVLFINNGWNLDEINK